MTFLIIIDFKLVQAENNERVDVYISSFKMFTYRNLKYRVPGVNIIVIILVVLTAGHSRSTRNTDHTLLDKVL